MTSKLKSSLNAIIEVSQALLSELNIDVDHGNADNGKALIDNLDINIKQDKINEKKIQHLIAERLSFITQLFEQYTKTELSSEIDLLNKVVSLNSQLILLSQSNKQMFALQIAKLKKSNKMKSLYQKY